MVLFWTVLGSVGALPFIFSESPNLTITDAFFESFSGLTTTGATTLVGLDSLPHAILFIVRCCNGLAVWGSLCWRWRFSLSSASGDAALSGRNAGAVER